MLQRGEFARIAIDLDMTKPLPTKVYLDGIQQQVLYENIPQICYECGKIGHLEDQCPECNPPHEIVLAVVSGDTLMNPPVSQSLELPTGYGPWMQVTRKSRKQTKNKMGNSSNLPLSISMDSGKIASKSGGKGKVDNHKGAISAENKGNKETKDEEKNARITKGESRGYGNRGCQREKEAQRLSGVAVEVTQRKKYTIKPNPGFEGPKLTSGTSLLFKIGPLAGSDSGPEQHDDSSPIGT
ncbi:unnamed protein product [Linum trigynum]|uniref:CCHC-type domain-containing protein n=1 Tax=Linum trigynum TaxID=586398 RepID=A0AAV2FS53_9ROSI